MGGGGGVAVAIFMSFFYYMFQSILNTFGLGYFFGGKKFIIFTDGGYPPPFAENSAKIINLVFEPLPSPIIICFASPQNAFSTDKLFQSDELKAGQGTESFDGS